MSFPSLPKAETSSPATFCGRLDLTGGRRRTRFSACPAILKTPRKRPPGDDTVFTVDTEDEPGDVSAGDLSEIEGEFRADADKDAAAGHEAVDLGAAHLGAKHLDGYDQHLDHLDGGHLDGNHPAGEHVHALAQRLKGESPPFTAMERGLAALNSLLTKSAPADSM